MIRKWQAKRRVQRQLKHHLYEVHKNDGAYEIGASVALEQHWYEHNGPGGLHLHTHPPELEPVPPPHGESTEEPDDWEMLAPPRPSRFWTYSRSDWTPRWWNKLGVPEMGAEEWGRRTFIIGTALTGYLCIVLWTCWCSECHSGRGQTYWFKHRDDYKHLGKIHGPGSTFMFNDDKWTIFEVSQEVHISGRDQLRLLATHAKFCKCGDRLIPGDGHVCSDLRGERGSFQRDRESMMEEE